MEENDDDDNNNDNGRTVGSDGAGVVRERERERRCWWKKLLTCRGDTLRSKRSSGTLEMARKNGNGSMIQATNHRASWRTGVRRTKFAQFRPSTPCERCSKVSPQDKLKSLTVISVLFFCRLPHFLSIMLLLRRRVRERERERKKRSEAGSQTVVSRNSILSIATSPSPPPSANQPMHKSFFYIFCND